MLYLNRFTELLEIRTVLESECKLRSLGRDPKSNYLSFYTLGLRYLSEAGRNSISRAELLERLRWLIAVMFSSPSTVFSFYQNKLQNVYGLKNITTIDYLNLSQNKLQNVDGPENIRLSYLRSSLHVVDCFFTYYIRYFLQQQFFLTFYLYFPHLLDHLSLAVIDDYSFRMLH